MRPMLVVSASATLLLIASGAGWATGSRNRNRSAQSAPDVSKAKETPPAFNKTFEWEEKEVGPGKGVDHAKIAAFQAKGREDAARNRDDNAPRKAVRPAGVNGPATATLPTMDIEKAAPPRTPLKKAATTPPRQRDDLDNLLAENGVGTGGPSSSGLDSVIGRSHKHHAKPKRHRR
jgi:hypothetical protein